MKAEDVSDALVEVSARITHEAAREETGYQDWPSMVRLALAGDREAAIIVGNARSVSRQFLAAIVPLIAAEALERAANEVDCGCACRDAVLAAKTSADRSRACGRDPCAAVQAAEIRAFKEE